MVSDIRGEERHVDGDDFAWIETTYRILVCGGCQTPYFQTEGYFHEDGHRINKSGEIDQKCAPEINFYPSPIKRKKPEWSTDLLFVGGSIGDFESLFSDIYGCLNANLAIPAAVSIRTVIDRTIEILGIDPNLSFQKKLNALLENGNIDKIEREILDVLIDAGSAAAHRGWKPKPAELDTLITLVETFLQRTFLLGESARRLKAAVPPDPRRIPKAKPQPFNHIQPAQNSPAT